jgi:hypothetical protein
LDYNKINYKNRKNKTCLKIDGMYHGGGEEEKKEVEGRKERKRERTKSEVRC